MPNLTHNPLFIIVGLVITCMIIFWWLLVQVATTVDLIKNPSDYTIFEPFIICFNIICIIISASTILLLLNVMLWTNEKLYIMDILTLLIICLLAGFAVALCGSLCYLLIELATYNPNFRYFVCSLFITSISVGILILIVKKLTNIP